MKPNQFSTLIFKNRNCDSKDRLRPELPQFEPFVRLIDSLDLQHYSQVFLPTLMHHQILRGNVMTINKKEMTESAREQRPESPPPRIEHANKII